MAGERFDLLLRLLGFGVNQHMPAAMMQCGFYSFGQATQIVTAQAQTILHHMYLILVTGLNACVTLLVQPLAHFLFTEIMWHRCRKADMQPGLGGQAGLQFGNNALCRVSFDLASAPGAVQVRQPRKYQLEIIVQLGHGADSRT